MLFFISNIESAPEQIGVSEWNDMSLPVDDTVVTLKSDKLCK